MSTIDELAAAQQNGKLDAIDAAEQLTALLDLESVGLGVRGAVIYGRGATASVDLHLSDDTKVAFESFRDVGTASRLALELAATCGATPKLNNQQALRAVALIRTLGEHRAQVTDDERAVGWGIEYLQSAQTIDVDLSDQGARWEAFSRLNIEPYLDSRASSKPYAAATIVLRSVDGSRLVRCNWFRAYVRSEQDSTVSPRQIASRMERIGWERRGTEGRIKATCPNRAETLTWAFWSVPAGWEDRE